MRVVSRQQGQRQYQIALMLSKLINKKKIFVTVKEDQIDSYLKQLNVFYPLLVIKHEKQYVTKMGEPIFDEEGIIGFEPNERKFTGYLLYVD